MSVYVTLVVGLVIWIVAWTFGIKALDGFLITMALVLIATVERMMRPYLHSLLRPSRAGARSFVSSRSM